MAESRATFTVRRVESDEQAEEVAAAVRDVEGVMGVSVDPETGEATVRYDEEFLAEEPILDAVREAGYDVA